MQSRHTIYYEKNSVEPPRPSAKNIQKRRANEKAGLVELKNVSNERKTCATLSCVWCGNGFDDYAVRCKTCGLCQYCGSACPDYNGCTTCGNILPEELKPKIPLDGRRRVRV